MNDEWTVIVRGGARLIRSRKFTDKVEMPDFITAVLPGQPARIAKTSIFEDSAFMGLGNAQTTASTSWIAILGKARSAAAETLAFLQRVISETGPIRAELRMETQICYDGGYNFTLAGPELDHEYAEELLESTFDLARTVILIEIVEYGCLTVACVHPGSTLLGRENWTVSIEGGNFHIRTRAFGCPEAAAAFVQKVIQRLCGQATNLTLVR